MYMNIAKGFFILTCFIGTILLVIYFMTNYELNKTTENKIVYKYIPKSLQEEQESPYFVSKIFQNMFSQGSVWIDSLKTSDDEYQKREVLNKYFISQF
jgi:hypothetical protein